jgi:hypothetical protein
VSIHIDPNPSEPAEKTPSFRLARTDTALAAQMSDSNAHWLVTYLVDRFEILHGDLRDWRAKMAKWERMSEGNYDDRIGRSDPNRPDNIPDIFTRQNDTLGLTEGFVDYFTAQARNDVFGTRPWLAATPEGRDDPQLAEQITRHANWKLNQSNLEAVTRDGIRIAAWGGTAFQKSRWIRDEETIKKKVNVAWSKRWDEAFVDGSGEFIQNEADFQAQGLDGNDAEWKDIYIDDTKVTFDNACAAVVDYNDIAFEVKAPELDLLYTDVFCRFRMPLLDAVAYYGIPEERVIELRSIVSGYDETAREHRGESGVSDKSTAYDETRANPTILLVEGFVRVDVLNNGKPVRIHVIFSPESHLIFKVDYLANVTPGGLLPIHPLRIHKIPGRVFGIGYFEKYEKLNDSVDRKHNIVGIRAREASHVFKAIQKDALRDPKISVIDPDKPLELAADKRLADLLEFAVAPDIGNGLLTLRDQELQMGQMRSGITSAAQGELAGVPSATTATGTNDIISRGAVLLKDPIDQLSGDIRKMAEFNVHLLYANQDRDETFAWGEGQDMKLLTISANDVAGLRMNVTLTMVQSQNQQKLQQAEKGIQTVMSYLSVPETDKTAARPMFVQVLSSLGFRDAEDIIRQAVVDPAGILALVPPDIAPVVQQALVGAGLMAPEPVAEAREPGSSAPVTEPTAP